MARKYLEDFEYFQEMIQNNTQEHIEYEKEHIKEYGFPEQDTWNLDITMIELLYERIKRYMDVGFVDLETHYYTIDNVKKTLKNWLLEILSMCEEYLTIDDVFYNDKHINDMPKTEEEWQKAFDKIDSKEKRKDFLTERIWIIWSKINRGVWW